MICLISQEIKKCSFRADLLFPFISPWIFMLIFSFSNAWSTSVEQNITKLLLTDKFPSKKMSQVLGSLLCKPYIYNKWTEECRTQFCQSSGKKYLINSFKLAKCSSQRHYQVDLKNNNRFSNIVIKLVKSRDWLSMDSSNFNFSLKKFVLLRTVIRSLWFCLITSFRFR